MTTAFIGQPVSRVDGHQKVTGGATYAAEFDVPGQAHAAIVRSTVANGRIASIDSRAAERATGVVAVLTHRNAPRLPYREHKALVDAADGLSDKSGCHARAPAVSSARTMARCMSSILKSLCPRPCTPSAASAAAERSSAGSRLAPTKAAST